MATTHRFIKPLLISMTVIALAVVVVLTIGSGSSPAESRSEFCRPDRTTVFPGGGHGNGPAGFHAYVKAWPGPVVAGDRPAIRIFNPGRDVLNWRRERVERRAGGSWIRMRMPGEGGGPTPLILISTLAESIGRCGGPETDAHWPSGRYRWTIEVNAVGDHGSDGHHLLRAFFHLQARHR